MLEQSPAADRQFLGHPILVQDKPVSGLRVAMVMITHQLESCSSAFVSGRVIDAWPAKFGLPVAVLC